MPIQAVKVSSKLVGEFGVGSINGEAWQRPSRINSCKSANGSKWYSSASDERCWISGLALDGDGGSDFGKWICEIDMGARNSKGEVAASRLAGLSSTRRLLTRGCCHGNQDLGASCADLGSGSTAIGAGAPQLAMPSGFVWRSVPRGPTWGRSA